MNLSSETARSQTTSPLAFAASIFGKRLKTHSDALYKDAAGRSVFAVSGLPFSAPLAAALLNEPELRDLLCDPSESTLLLIDEEKLFRQNRKVRLSEKQLVRIRAVARSILSAKGTLDEKGRLILDLKTPNIGTHYSVNLLLGDREGYADPLQTTPKSVLDRFGRGSFRSSQEKQVLATRYELNPDINGETANRQFYLTENGRQIFYSLNAKDNVAEAHCVHGNNYTEIRYVTECGLTVTRTVFILPQREGFPSAVEAQRIVIENATDRTRDLRIVATGMFGITDPATLSGDIIYANVVVESELYKLDGRPVAVAAHHKPKACNGEKRFAMLVANGEPMDEFTSDLSGFLGDGTYERPQHLLHLSNAHSRRGAAFFAMGKSLSVPAHGAVTVDELVGMCEGHADVREQAKDQIASLYRYCLDPKNLSENFRTVQDHFDQYRSFLRIQTGEKDLDAYLSHNLPFQVLYQTYISRSFAWTQKSYRETGFREIQDLFASMAYLHGCGKDALSRELLSSWIGNVFDFGYAYHNFTTRGKEPGMCSDDALWLAQAVSRYVKLSGDTSFLKCAFPVAGSDKKRKLIDTLKAILVYSGQISVGKHGLPLLDTADWNDTLRLDKMVCWGPEKEQKYYQQLAARNQEFGAVWDNEQSESVMNGFLLVIAAAETRDLADLIGRDDVSSLAKTILNKTTDSLNRNAWIGGYYARCLINDGRPYRYLGSTGDGLSGDAAVDGSYYLNSFSWSLLSGVADDEKIEKMLNIVEEYLKTDAGLKLCTLVEYDRLDVVTGTSFYFPGDRENGGVFKHAAMMAVVAALKAAKRTRDPKLSRRLSDLAFFMLSKTIPYKTLDDPFVLKGNPRFCTQYNNSETGENIGPILSGTSSWLTLALFEVCGIDLNGKVLKLDPIVNRPFFQYDLQLGGTMLHVSVDAANAKKMCAESSVYLDGKPASSSFPMPEDGRAHDIVIVL